MSITYLLSRNKLSVFFNLTDLLIYFIISCQLDTLLFYNVQRCGLKILHKQVRNYILDLIPYFVFKHFFTSNSYN